MGRPFASDASLSSLDVEFAAKESAALSEVTEVTSRVSPESLVVSAMELNSMGAEKFRSLSERLHQLRRRRPLRVIQITSAVPKEGKTLTAINLAVTLARRTSWVLLVDADLRSPTVHRMLGLDPSPGLAEYLQAGQPPLPSLRRVSPEDFYFLPAGSPAANPADLIEAGPVRTLFDQEFSRFTWVIIDSPPILPYAEPQCLAGCVDGVLIVVRAGFTQRRDLVHAVRSLEDAPVAGFVLNSSGERRQRSYYAR